MQPRLDDTWGRRMIDLELTTEARAFATADTLSDQKGTATIETGTIPNELADTTEIVTTARAQIGTTEGILTVTTVEIQNEVVDTQTETGMIATATIETAPIETATIETATIETGATVFRAGTIVVFLAGVGLVVDHVTPVAGTRGDIDNSC